MKLKLSTNYVDYYDSAFDREGVEFKRFDNGGMPRREMLSYLNSLNFETPRHGLVREVAPQVIRGWHGDYALRLHRVVVYTDENAHRGQGKLLVSIADALEQYPDHYCTEYIIPERSAVSFRHLYVGSRNWLIRYWSDSDWRSNCGEGGFQIIREGIPRFSRKVNAPLWAVDNLAIGVTSGYAIDFNIAPSLTPLRDILRPGEVYDLICRAVDHYGISLENTAGAVNSSKNISEVSHEDSGREDYRYPLGLTLKPCLCT